MKKTKNNPDHEKLRVLILEDSPADAELIVRALRKGGINFTSRLVDAKREFNKALADFRPQVILSDFKLPAFNGLAALESARLRAPDTPFIFVSGSIGEEKAIETLALGAADYIFKENLQRLVPAVKRVIEETRLKQEKKLAEDKLRSHVEELRLLAEAADFFVQTNDLDKIYDYLAEIVREISGADYVLLSVYDQALQAVRPKKIVGGETHYQAIRRYFNIDPMQMVFYFKDMRPDDFGDFVSRRLLPVRDGLYGLANRKLPRQVCRAIEKLLAIDAMFSMGFSWENQLYGGVTIMFKKGNELKSQAQVENLLNQAAVSIKRLLAEQALAESETKYRTLVTQSPDGIFVIDLQGNFLSVNQSMCDGLKYSEMELLSMKIWDIVPEQYVELHKRRMADIMQGTAKNEAAEYMVCGKDGESHYVEILSAPFYKDKEFIGLQGIAREITEKKKMELRLRESEEYYRTLVDTSPDAIVICDGGGRITFASQKAYEMFGLSATAKISGAPILEFVEPTEISRVQSRLVEILSGRSLPDIREYRLQRLNGESFWADVSSAPLRDHAGRNIGLLLICRDVSERKQAETALRESEEKYRLIADNTAETITLMDLNLRFTYVSPSIFKLRGYTIEEALNLTIQQTLTPDSLLKIQQVFSEEMALEASGSADPKRSRTLELQEYHKDGSIIWVENSLSFLRNPEGKLTGIIAVSKDISERKQAEDLIRASLKEKEVLLQEIHHRVKNNLQIISGLLTLQAEQAAGKSLAEIFRESQDRIRSIALIHEKLYRSHNLAEIAFDDYLRALVENLFISHGVSAGTITIKYEMESILFTIEKAIPLGLIVNELVTNALKHAFPDKRQGEIRITLQECRGTPPFGDRSCRALLKNTDPSPKEGTAPGRGTARCAPTYELTITDNGIGFPAGLEPSTQKSLGMNLVSMLVKQIQAEFKFKTGPGAEFRLLFTGQPANENVKDGDHDS